LAEDPTAILGRSGVDATRARFRLEPYQSLEEEIVARRRAFELEAELAATQRRIETTPILMRLDSTEILAESLVWIPALVRDLQRGLELARGASGGDSAAIEVIGHTDLSGDEQRNELLSTRRAERVRALLVEQGFAPETVSVRGVAARDFAGNPDAEDDLRRNRRVDVRLRIGSTTGGTEP
jgi:outer membrane protein OmpA-like peptidoglycan-associated protein